MPGFFESLPAGGQFACPQGLTLRNEVARQGAIGPVAATGQVSELCGQFLTLDSRLTYLWHFELWWDIIEKQCSVR